MKQYSGKAWEAWEIVDELDTGDPRWVHYDTLRDLDSRDAPDSDYIAFTERIKSAHDEYMDKPVMIFANAYAVTRHYGGPEEGGWWFNSGSPLASIPCATRRQAVSKVDELARMFAEHNDGDIYSVLGGVEVSVCIEEGFAEHWPKQRPHYE